VTNQLLARLARADARLLEPHLEAVDLPVRKQLQARNRRVERIYFPDRGIASVVANGDTPIEVGMVGREGMTGISVLLGDDERAQHETYMQVGGNGRCLAVDRLREAIAKSSALHQVLLRYVQVFLRQTTETALANGRGKIEERLARWLLMAHDRIDGDELKLTHEFSRRHAGRAPVGHNHRIAGAGAQGADRASAFPRHRPRPRGLGASFKRRL
jgi:CRP-like cAMP-binding protein